MLLSLTRGIVNGRNLRHADTGDNAGRTNRTGAYTDLYGIGTCIYKSLGSFSRGYIAGYDRYVKGFLYLLEALKYIL